MKKMLSIDGGDIRGIIPAMVLAEIERRTGKLTSEVFDLVAGTSTGGILALGLTKPGQGSKAQYSAETLIELYETESGMIFDLSVWHRLHSVGGLAEEKYPSKGIDEVAHQYFGDDVRLAEALTEVLVTAYEIERRGPWFFKRRHARDQDSKGDNFLMREVALATSAAPTYFEPLQLTWGPHGERAFIDGGVHSNNPAMCAYVEARKFYPEEDILVVSLGTGEPTREMPYEKVKGWGLALWAQPILNVVFDGVSGTVDYQLRELLRSEGDDKRYYRFQIELDPGKDDMDDANAPNIQSLKTKAKEIMSKNDADLGALWSQLVA